MFFALLVGIVTALVSLTFNFILRYLIQGIVYAYSVYAFEYSLLPLLGGVILGLMNKYVITKNRSFDIIAIEEEIHRIEVNVLKVKDVLLKVFASIISLISGYSLGRLGTIVYFGGFIGSYVGYNINANEKYVLPLIGCGVSGMIAGIFGSPLLAIFFVNEILIKERNQEVLLLSALSALTSYLVTESLHGEGFILSQLGQSYDLMTFNIGFIFLFIILVAIIGLFFIFSLKMISKEILSKRPFVVSVLAGLALLVIGLKMPMIFTVYQGTVIKLQSITSMTYLLAFILIKCIVTSISYKLGGYGGLFLPIVVIGISIGQLFYVMTGYGHTAGLIILGISSFFTSLTGGPLTGVILGFVLSGYQWEMLPILLIINCSVYYIIKKSPLDFVY